MTTVNSLIASNDVLDRASQHYHRSKSDYSPPTPIDYGVRHDLMLKNLYREQLDDIMRHKEQRRRLQQQQSNQERQAYNENINFNKEAQRLKDLSYKNYYNLLLNNQSNISKNHPILNIERQSQKEQLVSRGVQQERVRSQKAWEAQQKRLEEQRRAYREQLDRVLVEKNLRNAEEIQTKLKHQQAFKNVAFSAHQVAKLERDRKLMQMSKYKQDLERSSPLLGQRSRIANTGTQILGKNSNDFNIFSQANHNPMVNPLPYNIQNPYILREFMKRQALSRGQVQEGKATTFRSMYKT